MRDINPALAYVDQHMHLTESITQKTADEHLQAFQMQMREKVGIDEIALNEPYLPQLLARFQSQYLGRMDNIKRAIVSLKSFHADTAHKAMDSDEPLMPQVE